MGEAERVHLPASIHAVKAHYRADLREIRTGKGTERGRGGRRAPLNVASFFLSSPTRPPLVVSYTAQFTNNVL